MRPVVLPLFDGAPLAATLATALDAEPGTVALRRFPDGETHVRIPTALAGRAVVIACPLDRPDAKILPLLFTAATARDLDASCVGLVAPYLPYLRQDARFAPGDGVTARYFPRILGPALDWLVTVDPHLHRLACLDEVYAVPVRAVSAAPAIAAWLRAEIPDALLVGPDAESRQWVERVAEAADVPAVVLEKVRHGDRAVTLSPPDLTPWPGRVPVLVDDIVSTARTMIAAVAALRVSGTPPPVCVGVHAIFAEDAHAELLAAGAARVVTCNTVPHATNAIDVGPALAAAVRELVAG